MKDLSEQENKIINALKSLKTINKRANTKTIADAAHMSASVASKYLSLLEQKEIVIREEVRPHIYWELK